MAWLAVDNNGSESIFSDKPSRYRMGFCGGVWESSGSKVNPLKGYVEKMLERHITWNDEAV